MVVVDDNAGFREALLALLDAGDLEVVGEARSGGEALELVPAVEPDVVLMDVRMPEMDGIQTTRRLKELFPAIGVVALSGHEDQDIVREMLVAGASGYVLKDSDGDEILNAVLQAALGGGVLSPEVTPSVIEELTDALARERKRIAELEVAQAALIERSVQRHELIARLSHELRTPVTVILGMAQTLVTADPKAVLTEEQRRELLERIVERAQALAHLVERFELTIGAQLAESVDMSAMAMALASGEPRVRLTVGTGPFLGSLSPVVGRRILVELVDNALRFSPPESSVEVHVERSGAAIEVRVTDHGPGIDPADQERVFGFLEQLEDLNIRTHQGVGLGLSLARAAARSMGGEVGLESSCPEGSTFRWTIPVEDP